MSENSGYTPASWSADTSFDAARDYYKTKVTDRGYDDAVATGKTAGDLVEARLTTTALVPVTVFSDQTGSMKKWPETIFAKLGYLDHEANYYFGDGNWAISFGAFGDAQNREKYPFQARPFCTGADMKKHLDELVPEGNGGGNMHESAELSFVYSLHNVDAPNAEHPILILITDEKCYDVISPDYAKTWAKVDLKDRVTTPQVIEALRAKGWSINIILKPYDDASGDGESRDNKMVREFWEKLVGADSVYALPDANRVVDVIFGIFAKETGKYAEFYQELRDRQLPDKDGAKKVAIVEKALKRAHAKYLAGDLDVTVAKAADEEPKRLPAPGASRVRTKGKVVTNTDSKSLLPDDED